MDKETKAAFAEARQHTTNEITSAVTSAVAEMRQFTKNAVASAVTEMRQFTKDEVASAVTEMRQFTKDEVASAVTEMRQFTKTEVASAVAEMRQFTKDEVAEVKRTMLDLHHQTGIRFERMEHKIDLLVEAFGMNTDKIKEVDAKHDSNVAALDVRVTRLEAANARRRR